MVRAVIAGIGVWKCFKAESIFCVTWLGVFACGALGSVDVAKEGWDRKVLVDAILAKESSAQSRLVAELWDSEDPAISELLNSWRCGEVFVYEKAGREVPVIFETGVSTEEKARVISVQNGEFLKDEQGHELRFAREELRSAEPPAVVRTAIRQTLSVLHLKGLDPKVRRDAALELGFSQKKEVLPALERALACERVASVRRAVEAAIGLIQLKSEDIHKRMDAALTLRKLRMLETLPFVESAASSPFLKAEERSCYRKCIQGLKAHQRSVEILGLAFRGLSLGAVLVITALGLAVTFGIMRVINMGHGEFIALGAYGTYIVQSIFLRFFGENSLAFNWYFVAAIGVSFGLAAFCGLVLERCLICFLYKRPLESLLATWGVSLVLQQTFRSIFGAANVQVRPPSWLRGGLLVDDVLLPYNRLFILALAVVLLGGVWVALYRTRLGVLVRGVAENPEVASCFGVSVEKVNMWSFAFGSGLAGIGGACLAQIGSVGPSLGQSYIVDCFMTVVLGGVGSLVGTIVAGLGIGGINEALEPILGAVLGKVAVLAVVILFLQWKPSGLLPAERRGWEE